MFLQLPRVICHRAGCAIAPENTLAAARAAYQHKGSWIEFDVMLTKDGEAVVIHDLTLDRTTDGEGEVAAHTYEEIAGLDAGLWFGAPFIAERVPTFAEMLRCAESLELGINVEIKPALGQEIETVQAVLQVLEAEWLSKLGDVGRQRLLVSSFSQVALVEVWRLRSDLALGYVTRSASEDALAFAKKINCVSLHVNYAHLTAKLVSSIRKQNLSVLVYTVNELKVAKQLFAWGVSAVFSDHPDLLFL